MLFYASLFIMCVAVSSLVVWFYRSFEEVGKAVYRALLPSRREDDRLKRAKARTEHVTYNDAKTPWGWGDSRSKRARHVALATATPAGGRDAVPWGWPGSSRPLTTEQDQVSARALRSAVDRAVDRVTPGPTATDQTESHNRQDDFEFAGRRYKVVKRKRINTRKAAASKPWGW